MLGCNRILYSPIGSVISLFPIMRDRSHFEECRGCGFTGDIRTERETRKGQQKSRRGTAKGGREGVIATIFEVSGATADTTETR